MSADTQFMIFDFKSITAESVNSYGAPLEVTITTAHGAFQLTLYTDDQDLSNRLEIAINQACATPARPIHCCPAEKAAYLAAAEVYEYRGGSR